ncbi:ATP-dependent acyl-CoA ligase [Mesorhizobium sp. LHD-90]|uniref:ATP-dependent acyl-CoA ligase n=1 Tax=Mesorhizobium sp. LHD-90 TaxID=3071414 RepID=UPI0027E16969|nr:ATP-dependent acyl-CoA ligase [Mesorhizobium sp. LHD-90]MDQ6438061.1 ATP-dependent acyl-CoA ligase [Mesorhizobium sp. LHD-90]
MPNAPSFAAGETGELASALPARFPADRRCIAQILDEQAEAFADRPLFAFEDSTWTYTDMRDKAARAGALLATAGIGHGDRVAIFCSNRPEFLELFLGCGWIGAILVPINTASRGPQLRHVLGNCGARLLIVEAELSGAFDGLDAELAPVETIWIIGDTHSAVVGARPAETMPAYPSSGAAPAGKPADTLTILYTSGTTGPAKGVCCPQAQFFWWGVNTARGLGISEGDVLFTTLPLFHTNALNCFWQALLTGSTYVLERKFSASSFWKSAARHKATVGYLLGAMAAILLTRPAESADRSHSIRVALGGGVPGRFHQPFLERFGVPLLDAYGSTETNFVFGGDIPSKHPGTMGYLLDGFQARIVDENDVEVAYGQPGELILRADEPFAFATGYFGMPEKTVESWRNLWFHTGDRVARDPAGNFRFVDRMKDAIRRRGENISSWEVEQVLLTHPSVSSCAVYGVPSELGEDEVMASIIPASGHTIEPAALLDFCRSRLAYFAVPRYLDFVDTLPLTENGKIQKVRLRERGTTKTTWDRERFGYELKR